MTPDAAPPAATPRTEARRERGRLFVLDGWRGISILLVLSAHFLPLGPKRFGVNEAAGQAGMSIFFTLSGFLITQQLHAKRNVAGFFVRRLFRIVPLAWLYTIIALTLMAGSLRQWAAHLFFYANYDLATLTPITGHFWSLCVEVQFYVGIGLLMAVTSFRGFVALPVAWLIFFLMRCLIFPLGTIQTHLHVDEILSGTCLALVYLGIFGPRPQAVVARLPFPLLAIALVVASHPATGPVNALRGALASCLVGHTLIADRPERFRWLAGRALRYVAEVSYAVYVIHPLTQYGWLGRGPTAVKYAKRVLSFLLTFALAHLSTFRFEKPLTDLGKRLASRIEKRTPVAPGAAAKVGVL